MGSMPGEDTGGCGGVVRRRKVSPFFVSFVSYDSSILEMQYAEIDENYEILEAMPPLVVGARVEGEVVAETANVESTERKIQRRVSVHDVECSCNHNHDDGACEHGGDRIMSRGSSGFVSMYSKKGSKGVNQDALTVWKDFTAKKDMIFCGVFDGHGPLGHKFSQSIRDKLPSKLSASIKQSQQKVIKHNDTNATDGSSHSKVNMSFSSWEGSFMKCFTEMDEYLAKNIDSKGFSGGSTAVTVIKQGDQLIIGNLGDSRAVLCRRTDDNHLVPVQLTVDLTPDIPSEALRIINCGGKIFSVNEEPRVNRIWRPNGSRPGLAMARAFGNFCLKDYGLISVPDVSYRKLTEQDEFVVLASDGVWDVLTNSEVIDIVASAPKRSMAAKLLVDHAVKAWKRKYVSMVDDCTAICLFLKDQTVLTQS
ncbi:protein phosphatase 2C 74 [Vigna angularis]|uniref:Protein phosphatase 2C 74 n=1 Tax=Phaseolus angularis TaxID=3914 RepID=A0A8T0JRA3_PHAAN|nr:protein phosphatase 2C 74 [Vigna angularis]